MPCYFCEQEHREYYSGYWCKSCRELKNICNVYGYKRSLDILKKVCIRTEDQLENKIHQNKNKKIEEKDTKNIILPLEQNKVITRSQYNASND